MLVLEILLIIVSRFYKFCSYSFNYTNTPKPLTRVISKKKVVFCFSIVMVSSCMFLDILV